MGKRKTNLLAKIQEVLKSRKIPETSENIANACFEAVIELVKQNKPDFKRLLGVVATTKAFEINEISLQAIRMSIKACPDIWCQILSEFARKSSHSAILDAREFQRLIRELLANVEIPEISRFIVGYFDHSSYFDMCNTKIQVALLKGGMDLFPDGFDIFGFISVNSQIFDSSDLSQLLVQFLVFKNNSDSEIPISCLRSMIDLMIPMASENLEISTLILTFYRRHVQKAKIMNQQPPESLLTQKFVEIIRHEVCEAENRERDLVVLFSLLSDSILPTFSSLINDMNASFLKEGTLQKVLQNIISYIGIPTFADVVGSIDISRHYLLFKGLSNMDLGVFFGLYHTYSKGIECEIPDIDYSRADLFTCVPSTNSKQGLDALMTCLASFCYYCTDHSGNCENLMKIFKRHIETYPTIVYSALERLLYSHTNNLNNTLLTSNPIPKEESMEILRTVRDHQIVYILLGKYVKNTTHNIEDALKLLINLSQLDLSGQLVSIILEGPRDLNLSLVDALRLMPFFIDKCIFEEDFISGALEYCSSQEVSIQKSAYRLLHAIYASRRTRVCICDLLYTSLTRTANQAAENPRISLLYTVLKNGCLNCKIEDRNEMFNKFLSELATGIIKGNTKCRRIISEVVVSLLDDDFFLNFLDTQMSEQNGDVELLSGCILISFIILQQINFKLEHSDPQDGGSMSTKRISEISDLLLNAVLRVSMHSSQVARHALRVFRFAILKPEYAGFYEKFFEVVDLYIGQFGKKLNSDLKRFCISARKRELLLLPSMKTLLKFRNKGGEPEDITVCKRSDFKELL